MANLKGDEARGQFINLFKEIQRLKTQLDQHTDLTPDAIVANPPFSYRWEPTESLAQDFRFKNYFLKELGLPLLP